jgi:GST-like protein
VFSTTTIRHSKIHCFFSKRAVFIYDPGGQKPTARLYGVLDRRLGEGEYVAAGEYTIADMAIFPWCRLHERQGQNLDDFPNVKRWFEQISARPAVAKDMEKLEDVVDEFNEETWSASFGAEQYKRR